MSTLLTAQLDYHRQLNARLVRARRRMLRTPSPFFVHCFLDYQRQAHTFTDALLTMAVPVAHDEQVYALLADSFICLSPAS